MSATYHKHETLERLALGSVVIDRQKITALKIGPDAWLICSGPGAVLRAPMRIMHVPVRTETLALPATLQPARKEVTK